MKYLEAELYESKECEYTSPVLVNLDKLISRLKSDTPEYHIDIDTKNVYSINRVNDCINHIKKNINKKGSLELPSLGFQSNKIGVIDGRHRIIANKKIGYTHIYVDIPNSYKDILLNLN